MSRSSNYQDPSEIHCRIHHWAPTHGEVNTYKFIESKNLLREELLELNLQCIEYILIILVVVLKDYFGILIQVSQTLFYLLILHLKVFIQRLFSWSSQLFVYKNKFLCTLRNFIFFKLLQPILYLNLLGFNFINQSRTNLINRLLLLYSLSPNICESLLDFDRLTGNVLIDVHIF